MISVKNKEPQIYYGSKTIKEVYKGSTKIYPSIDQQAIMDSLVCWYDLGKQQCTNESMAANPVLADLSGNGHDITCYNFEWAEESGISTTNYPNALVSDGVDDYAMVEGLPILTKEKGYTVIAKRKLFYKENALQTLASTGAFILERQEINNSLKNTYNFGSVNTVTYPEEITYQTSKSFNGTSLNVGDSAGTDSLKIFVHTDDYTSIALHSFLLFDRDLTTAEIEWVKKNMIESGGVLKTDWSDSSLWAFYNIVNGNRIEGNVSSNRMLITANGRRTDVSPTANFMEVYVENVQIPAYNIKVTGLKNGIVLTYMDRSTNVRISEDGIYSIPEHNTQDKFFGYRFNKAFENENIVIQQLLSE